MKLKLKEVPQKAKKFCEDHATALKVTGVVITASAFGLVCYRYYRNGKILKASVEASGKKILKGFGPSLVLEGTGPIWDKLREIFANESMKPGEVWMVEANEFGQKAISYIGDGPLQITQF